MISIQQVTRCSSSTTRNLGGLSPLILSSCNPCANNILLTRDRNEKQRQHPSQHPSLILFFSGYQSTANPLHEVDAIKTALNPKDVVEAFKAWFKSRKLSFLDRIYEILCRHDKNYQSALSQLCPPLSEEFVLQVLAYCKARNDVESCLKFFEWAGLQHRFHHTRSTYHAIFKILAKAKLMPFMLDILEQCVAQKFVHKKVGFYSTLVMGYAMAGKPEHALQMFGKMRFQGVDLTPFAYQVLLNALVEEARFDAVNVICRQISARGFENHVTHSIIVKSLCKRELLKEAEDYLCGVMQMLLADENGVRRIGDGHGHALGILVDALCKNGQFDRARELVDVFGDLDLVPMEPAYGLFVKNLVVAGKADVALEFLNSKKSSEGYIPEVFRWNMLLYRLLKESRLKEALDLLMDMKESGVLPDNVTMNAALCFFCKAGMVDVALELYNSRVELELSPNSLAYNYLINSLCGYGSIDEAYRVLRNSMERGYFPGKRTFSILTGALCRQGNLDRLKELVVIGLEQDIKPNDSVCDKIIRTLCRSGRVEDGYLLHGEFNKGNSLPSQSTFENLIRGFNRSKRGEIAARLLIEMQDKGHPASRALFRAVIHCLCHTGNSEMHILNLLAMQLSHQKSDLGIYNDFIGVVGNAKKPELARVVFEMMQRSGIVPNLLSHILILRSYLMSERISDAVNFFATLHDRRKLGKKVYNFMVCALCKIKKADLALDYFREMRTSGVTPTIESYESLLQLLCSNERYDMAVGLVKDYHKIRHGFTPFIGNVLLYHSLRSEKLYEAWVRSREMQDETPYLSSFGQLIGTFSGRIRACPEIDDLEKLIEHCFMPNIYTYNMLLRRLTTYDMDQAFHFFQRICQKGYEPNRWTYDILVHGLFKHGRTAEAKRWMEEMFRKGFKPTEDTILFV